MSNPEVPSGPPAHVDEDPIVQEYLTTEEYRELLEAELRAFQAEHPEIPEDDPRREQTAAEIVRIEALVETTDHATPGTPEPGV